MTKTPFDLIGPDRLYFSRWPSLEGGVLTTPAKDWPIVKKLSEAFFTWLSSSSSTPAPEPIPAQLPTAQQPQESLQQSHTLRYPIPQIAVPLAPEVQTQPQVQVEDVCPPNTAPDLDSPTEQLQSLEPKEQQQEEQATNPWVMALVLGAVALAIFNYTRRETRVERQRDIYNFVPVQSTPNPYTYSPQPAYPYAQPAYGNPYAAVAAPALPPLSNPYEGIHPAHLAQLRALG